MSQDTSGAGATPSTDPTPAWIISLAAMTSQAAQMSLGSTLDTLLSNKTGNPAIDEALSLIENELDCVDTTRADAHEDITALLKSMLEGELLEHLDSEIKKRVDERVDEMVAHLVAVQLDEYVSQSLRDDVDKQRRELDSVYVRLYNVEARRQNATVRGGDHSSEPLCHLLDKNGAKCGKFPASVSKLMELNDRELLELAEFYGGSDLRKKPRADLVNWVLRFSGVTFLSGRI